MLEFDWPARRSIAPSGGYARRTCSRSAVPARTCAETGSTALAGTLDQPSPWPPSTGIRLPSVLNRANQAPLRIVRAIVSDQPAQSLNKGQVLALRAPGLLLCGVLGLYLGYPLGALQFGERFALVPVERLSVEEALLLVRLGLLK